MPTKSHLKALLRKNFILWKRNKFCSLLEITIPIIFAFSFFIFRQAVPLQPQPLTTYYNHPYNFEGSFSNQMMYLIKDCNSSTNGGVVALVPEGDPIITALNQHLTQIGFKTQYFANNEEIDSFVQSTNYGTPGNQLCFGVVMEKNNLNNQYQYAIRFNTSTSSTESDIPSTTEVQFCGFLVLQNWIDNLILAAQVKGSPQINPQIASVNVPAYNQDPLTSIIQGSGSGDVFYPLFLPYIRMVNGILREKEKRIKDGMRIMGLNNTAFYLSWVITYLCIFTVISICVSAILVTTFFFHSEFGYVLLFHWLTCLSIIAMGVCITTLCNRAKVGNIVAIIILFMFGWLQQISDSYITSASVKFWASIGQPTSVALSVDHLIFLEVAELGLNSETVSQPMFNHYMWFHYFWMTFEIFFYTFLALYLDQVLPGQYGLKKHPLFCLMRRNQQGRQTYYQNNENTESQRQNSANFEEVDLNLKIQDEKNESIKILGLRKVYPNGKVAVDGVSYNMYQGQIFALLGHNGAGKTSTINIITGLYPATAGRVIVFGMDIKNKLDDVRKILGVCPQHDVLFDDLTVVEHLELFSAFKGIDPSKIQAQIFKIIDDLDLTDKKHYLVKNLSGGQKRRLSIAIAFIGGSRFILLDEPSSGMDTSARRRLWDMLKTYKHGKVILLTTHYMDEADYLGDRIAIMGEGRIQCIGRPLFLKMRFGVGYSLRIVKQNITDPSESITQYIKEVIPESNVASDVSAEIAIQLPLETASKFQELFQGLDNRLDELKISSYGISVTTLEEVFLSVSKIVFNSRSNDNITGERNNQNRLIDDFDLQQRRIKGKWEIFKTQFGAIGRKRYKCFIRDRKSIILELFLPVLMLMFGLAIIMIQGLIPPSPYVLSDLRYGPINDVWYATDVTGSQTKVIPEIISEFDSNFNMVPIVTNSISTFGNDIFNSYDANRRFSYVFNILNSESNIYNYISLVDTRYTDIAPFAMNKMNQALIRMTTKNPTLEINLVNSPFPLTLAETALSNTITGLTYAVILAMSVSFIPTSIVTFIVKEREINAKHQQTVSGVRMISYWLGNYFVDIVKYLIPCVLICVILKAMNVQSLVDGDKYPALWALMLSYGPSIIGFTYLTSFVFKDHGQAQTATFFGNFAMGYLTSVMVVLLRIIPNTNKYARIIQWIFMPFPTFAVTYGFLNLVNRDFYPIVEGYMTPKAALNIDIAGGNLLFLCIGAFIFFSGLFLVENAKSQAAMTRLLRRDIPYIPKDMDGDVEDEMENVKLSNKDEFSIKADQIRKVYFLKKGKTKVAVDRVSFGIKNGECFTLLGVNGAGKTTTFKMLTGEIPPTSGEIYIKGSRVPMQMPEARKYIGYCPQFDTLLENLTVREHLELYSAIKGIPKEIREPLIQKQLSDLSLKKFENIQAGTLSGGNKRKLSVAIAIIGNPPIVFLDEPSTGMDPEARRFMWSVISRISIERKHSSIILTTHSMEEAEALSTKIGIQVDGNLVCLGSTQHIKNRYGGGFEIEIKMNIPTREKINELIQKMGIRVNDRLLKTDVEAILKKIGYFEQLDPLINEKGSGSSIYSELQKGKKTVAVEILAEWALTEVNGFNLIKFLDSNIERLILIENIQTFYRFRIGSENKIGKVFGLLEQNKKELGIMQYSVKQGTLEQIFNSFANRAVPVKTKQNLPTTQEKKINDGKNEESIEINTDFKIKFADDRQDTGKHSQDFK